jgi:hypothetical protein
MSLLLLRSIEPDVLATRYPAIDLHAPLTPPSCRSSCRWSPSSFRDDATNRPHPSRRSGTPLRGLLGLSCQSGYWAQPSCHVT